MARRAKLSDLTRRFDVTWFLGAIHKYRHLLGEVLVISFFLQLFALVSPLFFQVVIDKVLVHRSLSTLDVLMIGLVAIALFEGILGTLRTYLFAHTTNRIDVELGARLFRHLMALPIALFPGTARRRFGGPRARAGEHPPVPHQLRADARHRSPLHLRVPGCNVLLLAAADVCSARRFSVLHRDLSGSGATIPQAPRREVPTRCGEPGVPGRKHHRRRDAQGDGGRATDAAPLGGAARWLRGGELSRLQPGQHGKPGCAGD